MRCVCRPAIVKILGIFAILAISLHIVYKQGPVVDMGAQPIEQRQSYYACAAPEHGGCRLAALGSRRCRAAAKFVRLPPWMI